MFLMVELHATAAVRALTPSLVILLLQRLIAVSELLLIKMRARAEVPRSVMEFSCMLRLVRVELFFSADASARAPAAKTRIEMGWLGR